MEQAEKLYQDNINEMVKKNREMLESSIDSSVKTSLNVENKCISQLRENYTRGSENLRKQFDSLMSQAVETIATDKTAATK
jgi:hypothetical protein